MNDMIMKSPTTSASADGDPSRGHFTKRIAVWCAADALCEEFEAEHRAVHEVTYGTFEAVAISQG